MLNSTATLIHTSSVASDNALRVARVAAAGRVRSERVAAARREAALRSAARESALGWVAEITRDGAVKVGFKICDETGKHRFITTLADAVHVLTVHAGEDVEAWGIRADGEYCAEVW